MGAEIKARIEGVGHSVFLLYSAHRQRERHAARITLNAAFHIELNR